MWWVSGQDKMRLNRVDKLPEDGLSNENNS
jgi:hypothetical protein